MHLPPAGGGDAARGAARLVRRSGPGQLRRSLRTSLRRAPERSRAGRGELSRTVQLRRSPRLRRRVNPGTASASASTGRRSTRGTGEPMASPAATRSCRYRKGTGRSRTSTPSTIISVTSSAPASSRTRPARGSRPPTWPMSSRGWTRLQPAGVPAGLAPTRPPAPRCRGSREGRAQQSVPLRQRQAVKACCGERVARAMSHDAALAYSR